MIDGHRDTNDTACPGQHLYDALPKVRRRTARIIAATLPSTIVIDEPAEVIGTAHLGRQLRVDLGVFRPVDANATFRWLRGGRRIRGARERTYQVRPRDVGHAVSCRVTLTRDGLESVIQTLPSVGPVTADATLTIVATAQRRAARVQVTLVAPTNVRSVPTGLVAFTVGGRTKTLALEDGAAVAWFGRHRRLRSGTYRVKVVYGGDKSFTASTLEDSVRVP